MGAQAEKELREIIKQDYKIWLTDEQVKRFALSLLRLTRIGITALVRADENSSVQAREDNSLEAPGESV